MKRKRHSIKPYLELTTASLLASHSAYDASQSLPRGGLLLIAPEGNARVQAHMAQIARSFAALGGTALVRRMRAERP